MTTLPAIHDAGFRPPVPEPVTIPGPAGSLEARIEDPASHGEARRTVGVVCHPHPLHGGTLQNKVVHTLARAMQEAGAATVRFNFRGVGLSAGSYDEGFGEIEDAVAVAQWARAYWNCQGVWLAGFSFGAAIALRAADRVHPNALVTVAPPVGRLINGPMNRPACPWLIVQGDHDDLVDCGLVERWAAGFAPQAPKVLVLRGAEHFFHGRLGELRAGTLEFLRESAARTE